MTFPPLANVRTSSGCGSFVNRPISITLLRLAMGTLLRRGTTEVTVPDPPEVQGRILIVYIRLPPGSNVGCFFGPFSQARLPNKPPPRQPLPARTTPPRRLSPRDAPPHPGDRPGGGHDRPRCSQGHPVPLPRPRPVAAR